MRCDARKYPIALHVNEPSILDCSVSKKIPPGLFRKLAWHILHQLSRINYTILVDDWQVEAACSFQAYEDWFEVWKLPPQDVTT